MIIISPQLVFSTLFEVLVDFTRDYEAIKQALVTIEHYDKTCMENMLQAVKSMLLSNWGSQNQSQVLVFTDCGIGFGATSLRSTIETLRQHRHAALPPMSIGGGPTMCLPFTFTSKLSFICLGNAEDSYFIGAQHLYQELLNVSGQNGELFAMPATSAKGATSDGLTASAMHEIVSRMCDTNYKPFEAALKCGGYAMLECLVNIWPPPTATVDPITGTARQIKRIIEICGYLPHSEIGSPMSISRHLILPRMGMGLGGLSHAKFNAAADSTAAAAAGGSAGDAHEFEHEKLDADIKAFYAKTDTSNSDDESVAAATAAANADPFTAESVCVLLHGALKIESLAAIVALADDWFGFIFSYADSKKKSNLMLTILPPGYEPVPWLGDMRCIGALDDFPAGEQPIGFPVRPEKRSYAQNNCVWINMTGLHTDIQKVQRHAKKLPEKMASFYKELNRICKAAVSFGFLELMAGLANMFEREMSMLPHSANPESALQLQHTVGELRRMASGEGKLPISSFQNKFVV